MHTINELQGIVNKKLSKKAYEEEPIALFEPMTYALSVGGKRLRPVMVLLAAQMYGADLDYAMKPALGLEIFHNFTLLHDDVMDNADIRRNQPTVHKKWNENVAILSGDAMSIKAYQYIVSCKEEHIQDVLKVFNDTALEVCKGQQLDMEFEERDEVALEEYIQMIHYKTAVLFACSLKMGGILADAPIEQQKELYELGINIGLAFQVQDDYLDVYGNVDTFGKNIGGDILSKKKTFLLIKALEKSTVKDKAALLRLLNDNEIADKRKIEQVTEIYNKLEIKEISQKSIQKYIDKARTNLNNLEVDITYKEELLALISKLENRNV